MDLQITPVRNLPQIVPGMHLGRYLREALDASGLKLSGGDILAVTQKIISKAEGRIVNLNEIEPGGRSIAVAEQIRKDPRLVEVILRETKRIVRMRGDVLICETHHGFICANAGVDQSNTDAGTVTLLPKDPDRSARGLAEFLGCGIIVTDTFGRVWREGLVDTAIGIARVPLFVDYRGAADSAGRPLQATLLAAADALAAAAGLAMGKTSGTPAALIRGYVWEPENSSIRSMLRSAEGNLFL